MLTKIWYFLEKSLRFILIHIFHFKFSVDTWNHLIQFVKFGIIGISNTLISYLIYLSALFFLQKNNLWPNIDYLLAQFAGFMLSVLWSFYWNRKYVFDSVGKKTWFTVLIKTYLSYAFTGLFLNNILSLLWVEVLKLSKLIAPLFTLILSVPINFLINKFWAFRVKRD